MELGVAAEFSAALPTRAVALMAALTAGLAVMCVALSLAWAQEHRRVECYAEQAELGLVAGGECQ